ncbi:MULTISPECIES: DUF2273 domain-containing protein [Carnobacterium]|uniref:DUF2273 domain-containing protein n=1 Tax=Carnobacterium divergens TaxID=2748 RepID=A0A2R7ZWE2_CARDV|nr:MULTISPECIES: DUF2273 domain-containing protein [Carnobacterium]MCO6018604.1 DUF2273 domain-containing protein [Carnobacterium divergens]MDT1939749.1 DUF2273 domain-containing protein [Carnobacterium divergens]MDT1942187.1 DUF2273 domain-containing protein [Carnobacterium divergens]MDT1947993.1 DUF2273 domain-containing protein [Carnobacterium divergens]MDT1950473.1 DUF2273 domain-containing protein [Carnobacterium divergens]
MQPPESWYPYRGRIIGLLIGLIIALLLITIGFGYTLLIVLLASIGFIIGAWRDGKIDITAWLQFFMK